MHSLGLDPLSVFGLPPDEYVNLAADLGCQHIGISLTPVIPQNPHNYPAWSMVDDAGLRRKVKAALADRGVKPAIGEGFWIVPGADIRDSQRKLDLLCELGVPAINAISLEPDQARSFDQFAAIVEMAEAAGVDTTVEFAPIMGPRDIPGTLALLRHVNRPSFRMLVDTLHVARSGGTAKDVAALDPKVIGYVQLCDAPAAFTMEQYGNEASFQRMPPGSGELPLFDILKVLPKDVPIGLEIPMLKEAQAGKSLRECLGSCVEGAKKLLARLKA